MPPGFSLIIESKMGLALNPQVDKYLIDGCMRCKYGATPQCKVNTWRAVLEALRQVVLETGLQEEIKWGVPVYTHKGKNIVTVSACKAYACIGFFKGALLADSHQILQQRGNLQSDRLVPFTQVKAVEAMAELLQSYISEAVAIEESGQKVVFKKNPEPMPAELLQAFEKDPLFEQAFNALTPGRQRGYIIYFSQPKQSATRLGRIAQCQQPIMAGIGLHDKYSGRK